MKKWFDDSQNSFTRYGLLLAFGEVANAGGSNGTWQCVRYDGASTWWLVGGAGYLAKSTDMINWTQIDTPVTDVGGNTAYSIAFNTVRSS